MTDETRVTECHDDVCITCSDVAVPVRVVALLPGGLASVDTGQGVEEVSVALVDALAGDVVLVHAKEAIAVVPEEAP
ncbi:MAG: HypC/HybG/HupF family hydrogenase formation chaperone [Actinomycetes bacterium]